MDIKLLHLLTLLAGILLANLVSTTRVERDGNVPQNETHSQNNTQLHNEQPPNKEESSGQPPNQQSPKQITRIRSRNDLIRRKNVCARVMKLASKKSDQEIGECEYVASFSVQNMTSEEVFEWFAESKGEARALNMLRDPKTGLSIQGLKILLHNLTQMAEMEPQLAMNKVFTTSLSSLAEALFQRQGGIKSVTVQGAEEFGPDFLFMLPEKQMAVMSNDLLEYTLETFSNQTDNFLAVEKEKLSNVLSGEPITLDHIQNMTDPKYKGSFMSMAMGDSSRLKSLARAAFSRYKGFDSLSVDTLNKLRNLLPLAPPYECKKIPDAWVQDNFDDLAVLPMMCDKAHTDGMNDQMMSLFGNSGICGKYLAEKALTGSNAQPFTSVGDMMKFDNLLNCVPGSFIKTALQAGNCSLAKAMAMLGRPEVVKYTLSNCIQMPTNMSALNCSYIVDTFGPVLADMKLDFYNQIPESVLCESQCVTYFKGIDNMPSKLKRVLTKKCFSAANKVLDASAVDELGSMVTDLPPEKFKEINAADLERNIASIKAEMKRASSKKGRNKQAVIKEMGEKMMNSGKLSAIMDSKEIMKEVSLKDLKNSLTDIDSVMDTEDLALTDSQTKWVMRQMKKQKPAGNYSAEEIRGKKSLVKGFLRSDIKEMAASQEGSEDSHSLEMAQALCEQKNFPLAPLQAINRNLIIGGLKARNYSMPFSALSDIDVSGFDCQCLMHFNGSELSEMLPEVCSSVCTKLGSCDRFRCMTPKHRLGVQKACMSCMNFATTALTEVDMDLLGPNLLSELSTSQVQSRVTGAVLALKLADLKGMCMNKAFTTAVSGVLTSHFGSSGSALDETTLRMLGSAIMLFPVDMQRQMDKAVIMTIAKDIIDTLYPSEEAAIKLKKCCKQWMKADDLVNLKQLKQNLKLTIKDAVVYSMQNGRRKRDAVSWTCENVQLIGEVFTTVTNSEINAMDTTEFADCLTDIGLLTSWTDDQKDVLLKKAVESLFKEVCNMTVDQVIQLGSIAQAIPTTDLECLPMSDSDLVSALGGFSGWNSASLTTLAESYLNDSYITDLSGVSVSDVAMLGEIICGFSASTLSTLSVTVVAGSGIQLGRLSDCSIAQYTALKNLLLDPLAYDAVTTWSAATVTELNNLLVGLSAQDIQGLSTNAIEGLSADVISQLPPTVLAGMTTDQFGSLTSTQLALVTDAQKDGLAKDQITHLSDVLGIDVDDNSGNDGNPSKADGVMAPVILILSFAVMLILAV